MTIIAVTDANIFIDLIALNLIESFLSLEITIWTTEEVLMELYPPDKEDIIAFKTLNVEQFDKNTRGKIEGLSNHFSPADKSLLYLVSQLDEAILLSGEKRMRSWCKKQNIEVHGIIWVLQLLIDHKTIITHQAADYLTTLLTINNWLPAKTCLDQIEKWKSTS